MNKDISAIIEGLRKNEKLACSKAIAILEAVDLLRADVTSEAKDYTYQKEDDHA